MRLALRNLVRHRWRTGLTVGGVAVAVGLLVWTEGLMDAFLDQMIETVVGSRLGDLQISQARYVDRPHLPYALSADEALLSVVRAQPGIARVERRLTTFGLIGHEARSQVAMIFGVEPQGPPLARAMASGRWLERPSSGNAPREVVLGELFARQLEAKVGDELVLLLQAADGSSGDTLLRVVGTARTGLADLDRQGAFFLLDDLAFLLALEGRAHQLVLHLARGVPEEPVAAALGAKLASVRPALVVRTWRQLVPELVQMVSISKGSVWVIYFILYVLAALGILNAQRMSALERRREFGVMLAIGVTPARLGGVVLLETLVLTGIGAAAGALGGAAVSLYHTRHGYNLGLGEDATYLGLTFESVIHFSFHASMLVAPVALVLAVGLVCGLWPAFSSARLDAVRALSGRAG